MESWMGPDPVEQKVKELTPFWRRMQAENAARKARDQREVEEIWFGFAVGGYAWLTEEATLRRGGMRLVRGRISKDRKGKNYRVNRNQSKDRSKGFNKDDDLYRQ